MTNIKPLQHAHHRVPRGSLSVAGIRVLGRLLFVLLVGFLSQPALAATLYVDLNNPAPAAPYTNWSTAATNIQDAIDAAAPGDLVLVNDGVYQTGGRVIYGAMTNRVAVSKPLTLQSVNGPNFTYIIGNQAPATTNGTTAVRCVYLTNNAVLSGFTLTNGATQSSGDPAKEESGGGLWCAATNAAVSNCVICGNAAYFCGGGAASGTLNGCTLSNNISFQNGGAAWTNVLSNCLLTGNSCRLAGGAAYLCKLSQCQLSANSAGGNGGGASGTTLNNCILTGNTAVTSGGGDFSGTLTNCSLNGNSAAFGGGAYAATLNNCTLVWNTAVTNGGGAYSSALRNCIVYFNNAPTGTNFDSGSFLTYCCATPQSGAGGDIHTDPQLANFSHILPGSPCRGAGSSLYTSGLDIDGEAWLNPPSMGCDEYYSGTATGSLSVTISASLAYLSLGTNVSFAAVIGGVNSSLSWDFGDGVVASNQVFVSHAWSAAGDYPVVLRAYNTTYPAGAAATLIVHVLPQVRYAWSANPSPAFPYASWATAATNIQDAVDSAFPGDTVLVSNGVYQTGGRVVFGAMSNRVAVTKPLKLMSVNGPGLTSIVGNRVAVTTNGSTAVRCVYLASNTLLAGFTLTNGATLASGDVTNEESGGAVWCASSNSVVSNCVICGNSALMNGGGISQGKIYGCTLSNNVCGSFGGATYQSMLLNCTVTGNSATNGGGAFGGSLTNCALTGNSAWLYGGAACSNALNNCLLTGNSANQGGGSYQGTINNSAYYGNSAELGGGSFSGTLNNCTLTGNTAATSGGGASSGTLNNCIVYFNTAPDGNYAGSSLSYCCATPQAPGVNNLTVDPKLSSVSHLSSASPCRGAGLATYVTGLDIDGEAWLNPPSIGCDEYHGATATGALSVVISAAYTNVSPGFNDSFTALIGGLATGSTWDFGDGIVVSNEPFASHAWTVTGDYLVQLKAVNATYPGGLAASLIVHVVPVPVFYVSLASASPAVPYGTWATAATNIQDAVDAATVPGSLVLVSNGLYQTGGRVVYGAMTNRVAVTKPLLVSSLNGPAVTAIVGAQAPGTTNGNAAVRCVYLGNGASLTGFTLTNGATRGSGNATNEESGGGIWCASSNAVSNCVIAGNFAYWGGGGAFQAALNNCVLIGNSATYGGGAYLGVLSNCTVSANTAGYDGGGTYSAALKNCTLTGNLSMGVGHGGGGACYGTLTNCFLNGNTASNWGGGAFGATLNNCTVTGNSARQDGGGVSSCFPHNCILYFNSAPNGNYDIGGLDHCCTTPVFPGDTSNIQADPQLTGAYHLSATSPCRGAGSALNASGVDLNGRAWLNPPSIGCEEYYLGSANGSLNVAINASYTNVAAGFSVDFAALIGGWAASSVWDFGDGTVVTNEPYLSHAWAVAGDYLVSLRAFNGTNPGGVGATMVVHVLAQPIYYVSLASTTPAAPYASWTNAATNIQDAVDAAALPGSLVLVSNGTYQAGARVDYWGISNRLYVTHPVTVQSLNGPAVTILDGVNSIRCAYLANGTCLAGFTLTNGSGQVNGGGVCCETVAGNIVTNCVIAGCSVSDYGGGAYYGALYNCTLSSNSAYYGAGAFQSALNNCTLTGNSANTGGGAYYSTLTNCALTANSASQGGGADHGALFNCTLTENTASDGGGGSYAELFNCLMVSNSVDYGGGGAYQDTLYNCTLTGNQAGDYGGGAYYSFLTNCTLTGNSTRYYGGGANTCNMFNCMLAGNSAASEGGGAMSSTLYSCTLITNSSDLGGGLFYGTANNCTITGNTATNGGGGIWSALVTNCIISYNSAPLYPNFDLGGRLSYCCTTPLPSAGIGNFTNAPLFVNQVGNDFHLQSNSPCINAGNNACATNSADLDGNPRISGGTVDVGAYEFQNPASRISYAWLVQYGLALDGSADYADPDGDGMNNWQEWRAGTNPTNASSVLKLSQPAINSGNITLTWLSVTNVSYSVLRATNLGIVTPFSLLQGNIPGLPGTTSYTDTNAPSPAYYRLGVQ